MKIRKRHRVGRLQLPFMLERHYMAELRQVGLLSQRVVADLLIPTLTSHGLYGPKHVMDAVTANPFTTRVTKAVFSAFSPELLAKVAGRQANEVSKFHRQAITSQLTRAAGVGFWVRRDLDRANVKKVTDAWIGENIALIESIPGKYLEDATDMLHKNIGSGMRVEELAKKLDDYRVAESRANLIARDQTLKLYSSLNRERQKSIGLDTYIWRGTLDEKERPMHRDLEGQVITWGEPPVTNEDGDENDPGEDFQCRCTAEPNLD